jgi:Zn-dependent protease
MNKKRRVYYSFYDIEPKVEIFEAATLSITSKTEVLHLAIAIIVLSTAFSFALGRGLLEGGLNSFIAAINRFPIALFSILTGFFFHELSHKFTAQRYRLWAEFRMYPFGLFFAFLFGVLFGFVFAAPGAVTIRGGARRSEIGKIASAGPLANILVAAFSLFGYLYIGGYIGQILGFICFINIFLGFFNLLPFGPLDGRKIMGWNVGVWATLIILAIIVLTLYWGRMVIPGWVPS